jgi:hypothetical protein
MLARVSSNVRPQQKQCRIRELVTYSTEVARIALTKAEAGQSVISVIAALARFSGAVIAVFAVWSTVSAILSLLNSEPFGIELLVAAFTGAMAAVLLSARGEKPSEPDDRK